MKKALLLFAALLVAGCGEKSSSEGSESASENSTASNERADPSSEGSPDSSNAIDLDDPGTLDKIISEAIDWEKPGEDFHKESYTGWVKQMRHDGRRWRVTELGQMKDGQGILRISFHKNGQKRREEKLKDGEEIAESTWHENGQKRSETTYHDGAGVVDSEKYWNSKGEEVETWQEAEE